MVEDQRDAAGEIGSAPVVPPVIGGADPVSDEDERPLGGAGGRKALRVEPLAKLRRAGRLAEDLEPVVPGERGAQQAVALEEVASRRFEPGAGETGGDELGGQPVLRRVRGTAAHGVAGEEEQVGAEVVGGDGVQLGRPGPLGLARRRRSGPDRRERGNEERRLRAPTGSAGHRSSS